MPEFLALGGLRRTGDLAFGPTPDGPATWRPDEEPLVTLPDDGDDVEALAAAIAAVDDGEAEPEPPGPARPHQRRRGGRQAEGEAQARGGGLDRQVPGLERQVRRSACRGGVPRRGGGGRDRDATTAVARRRRTHDPARRALRSRGGRAPFRLSERRDAPGRAVLRLRHEQDLCRHRRGGAPHRRARCPTGGVQTIPVELAAPQHRRPPPEPRVRRRWGGLAHVPGLRRRPPDRGAEARVRADAGTRTRLGSGPRVRRARRIGSRPRRGGERSGTRSRRPRTACLHSWTRGKSWPRTARSC